MFFGFDARLIPRDGITALGTFVHDNVMAPADAAAEDLKQLGQAVEKLAGIDARLAEQVDQKLFAGLTSVEIAALRGGSERTAQHAGNRARDLLHGLLMLAWRPPDPAPCSGCAARGRLIGLCSPWIC